MISDPISMYVPLQALLSEQPNAFTSTTLMTPVAAVPVERIATVVPTMADLKTNDVTPSKFALKCVGVASVHTILTSDPAVDIWERVVVSTPLPSLVLPAATLSHV
jgi:hypothetical protein